MKRSQLTQKLHDILKGQSLYWFGSRSQDAKSLSDLGLSLSVFSTINSTPNFDLDSLVSLENQTFSRYDLDVYDIDHDGTKLADDFLKNAALKINDNACIVSYSSSAVFEDILYKTQKRYAHLGLSDFFRRSFCNKIRVETLLKKEGVRTLPFECFSISDKDETKKIIEENEKVVLRLPYSDGGANIDIITHVDQLYTFILDRFLDLQDHIFSLAPYLEPNIPLNTNVCLYKDGSFTLHPCSMQIIGHPILTKRKLGYCGNDFAAIKDLDKDILDQFETLIGQVCYWLHKAGYVGAFGIDALVYENDVYFVEINPRFQGSSYASYMIDKELDRTDIYLSHVAAHLNFRSEKKESLYQLSKMQKDLSLIVSHNTSDQKVFCNSTRMTNQHDGLVELIADPEVACEPNSTLFRYISDKKITTDGCEVFEQAQKIVKEIQQQILDN